MGGQRVQQFEPRKTRQFDVEEQQIRKKLLDLLQRLDAIARLPKNLQVGMKR
jgi:hypothetical protein